MQLYIRFVASVLLLAATATHLNAQQPVDIHSRDFRQQPAQPAFKAGKKWAVLIGVEKFPDGPLQYCVDDVELLAETLSKSGYAKERIITLVDNAPDQRHPTKANMEFQLKRVLDGAGANDTVLIFFSGHGGIDANGQMFLVPIDTNANNLRATAFYAEQLRDILDQSSAKRLLLILDCCHAAGVGAKGLPQLPTKQPSPTDIASAFDQTRGLFTIVSCAQNEKSIELPDEGHPEKGHGLFTRYLALGMSGEADFDGDRSVDLGELYRFTHDGVVKEAADLRHPQHPVQIIPYWSVGVLLVASLEGSLPRPKPPVLFVTRLQTNIKGIAQAVTRAETALPAAEAQTKLLEELCEENKVIPPWTLHCLRGAIQTRLGYDLFQNNQKRDALNAYVSAIESLDHARLAAPNSVVLPQILYARACNNAALVFQPNNQNQLRAAHLVATQLLNNQQNQLVKLTVREQAQCHYLLWFAHEKDKKIVECANPNVAEQNLVDSWARFPSRQVSNVRNGLRPLAPNNQPDLFNEFEELVK